MPFDDSTARHRERISVLRVDLELGERLGDERRARAERASVAEVIRREGRTWMAKDDADIGRDGLGLLVVEGTLVRRVGLESRFCAELLSAGDIVQPSQHDGEEATLPFEATWRLLEPLRLAVLDLAWMNRMAPFPEVMSDLAARIMVRSRRLASLLAISHHHRLDDRLRLLLWELADRYGRVCTDGVRLDLPLTHELVADLVGAHRPSVSVAIGRLERSGHMYREDHKWFLTGSPPLSDDLSDRSQPAEV